MDKNLKNSLLFGGIVGGLFALGRNAGKKQLLTPGQINDLNRLKEATVRLQNIAADKPLTDVLTLAKQHEADKKYEEVFVKIDGEIRTQQAYLGLIDTFKEALNQVLSPRFTAERANANTHKAQSNFSYLSPLPDLIETLVNKHIEILRLIRKGLGYFAAENVNDFKPDDDALLRSLINEMKALENRIVGLLQNVNFN
jgi:hypothetical protein